MNKAIILSTLNSRYSHASMGLRYLYANMADLQSQTELVEFTIAMRPLDIALDLLAHDPLVIGLGIYIWNLKESEEVVSILKAMRPDIKVVLGGPEVSYEQENSKICELADYVISGPGDLAFAKLCNAILRDILPTKKIIKAPPFNLEEIELPYRYYSDEDIQTRAIYVEASRGCPFSCEFCLSALDKRVYHFDLDRFLAQMEELWRRGLRQFRFVDRTFNLKTKTTTAILDFFLAHLDDALFLHFELVPDHLPSALKNRIEQFPAGSLQFEVGIQSFNTDVQERISRKQDNQRSEENLRWLKEKTHAHLHTDLVFGLPGEDLESFARGFNRLIALNPHEIQFGILKRLKGAPISRHMEAFGLVFNPYPPFNILKNDLIDFQTMQKMERFARYWDMIANSGRFEKSLPLILDDRPFERFSKLSEALFEHAKRTHKISISHLFTYVYQLGMSGLGIEKEHFEEMLLADYLKTGQKGAIPFLNDRYVKTELKRVKQANRRQLRHIDDD